MTIASASTAALARAFALVPLAALMVVIATPAAAETPLYDNWNPAACSGTDRSRFEVGVPIRVDRIEVWYNWKAGERSVAFRLEKDGTTIVQGTMARGSCDPYQSAWCGGDVGAGRRFRYGDLYRGAGAAGGLRQRRQQRRVHPRVGRAALRRARRTGITRR